MKIPRDVSAEQLVQSLVKLGYKITRQKDSHIRITALIKSEEHHITIPNHSPIKIGTLNKILKDIAIHFGINKEEVIVKLFKET